VAKRNINDVLTIELDRLDAEDGLARSKAKLGAVSNTAKARLRTAKLLRGVMCKRFEGGEIGAEDYLLWQKRYDDVADDVLAMTGADVIRLLEDRVAERKLALHRVRKPYENGHVKKTDALIAEYYLLEAEQALASSRAEVQHASGK
jgi:hypothetical protein